MADYAPDVTKQNITDLLYKASLINNTDLEVSIALSNIVIGITENVYYNINDVQNAVNNGVITLDTYIEVYGPGFSPRERFVDTAGNILAQY
jgi:hypothetical protein